MRWRSGLWLVPSKASAALILLLSFVAVEIHFATHQPALAEGLELHDHLSQPFHIGATPAPVETRCLVCLTSSQQRGPVCDLPAWLPQPLAAGIAGAREYPLLARFGVRRPISRGPPQLL